MPAVAVTLVAFVGSIGWTIWMSLHRSPSASPTTRINPTIWNRQYDRLFNDGAWSISLKNLVVLGHRQPASPSSSASSSPRMIDREKRGEGIFRTIFLYPLAVSLIVTGLAWRWMFNPGARHRELPARDRPARGSASTG